MSGRTIHRCAASCGKRVHKAGGRCQPCYYASMRGMRGPNTLADPAQEAERCSADLLRRQLATGQHWITDPVRFRAACDSVGMAA